MSEEEPLPTVACPCCGSITLSRRGEYDICPVCFWEDDGGDDPATLSGPNHMTLAEGRHNFARLGASSPAHTAHVAGRRLVTLSDEALAAQARSLDVALGTATAQGAPPGTTDRIELEALRAELRRRATR